MEITRTKFVEPGRPTALAKLSGIYPAVCPGWRYNPARIGCFINDPADYKLAGTVKQVKPAGTVKHFKPADTVM